MSKLARVLMAMALAGFGLVGVSPAAKAECPNAEIPFKNQDAPTPAEYGFIYTDSNGATRVNPANGPAFLVAYASFYGIGNVAFLTCSAGPVTNCVVGAVGALHPTEYVMAIGPRVNRQLLTAVPASTSEGFSGSRRSRASSSGSWGPSSGSSPGS